MFIQDILACLIGAGLALVVASALIAFVFFLLSSTSDE